MEKNFTLRLCVFCGSSAGIREEYKLSAAQMAHALYENGVEIVYGGGGRGLMGVLADTYLALGGEIVGVIPESLVAMEAGHKGLAEMRIVGSMHERKALMSNLSDGFIAMPGGFGTLEELFEVITWAQLGFHCKPIGLLNVKGYFDPLLRMVDHAVAEGFIPATQQQILLSSESPRALLQEIISRHSAVLGGQWIDKERI